jgi:hypothetical protein
MKRAVNMRVGFLCLSLLAALLLGMALSIANVQLGRIDGRVELEREGIAASVKPYLSLRVRGPDGSVLHERTEPAHSATVWLARLLALHLGAQYQQSAALYPVRAHGTWAWPYTATTTPSTFTHYGLDNGMSVVGAGTGYQPLTLFIAAGRSPHPSFDPTVSFLAPAPGNRFEAGPATAAMFSNATHAWVTLAATIPVSSGLTVEDVAIYLWPNTAVGSSPQTQFCANQRDVNGFCAPPVGPAATLIWWDKTAPVTVPAGGSLDVSYAFYTSFPGGGNLLAVVFSLLHTPRASENIIIVDTASSTYTNHFPEYHLAYTTAIIGGSTTRYLWPAVRLLWGTGTAISTGPWSPPSLVSKVGETDAATSVAIDPASGAMTITFTGIASNTGPAPLTITEVGIQLGGVAGVGELCLRQSGVASLSCPSAGKSVLLVYLPVNITVDPGKAVQIVVKITFSAA